MNKIRIGSYQGPIKDNNIEENLAHVLEVMRREEAKGLHFLCFPETYLSGYSPEAIRESAMTLEDERIHKLLAESEKNDTVYLVGFSEKREDGIYNGQIVFQSGQILGVAYKTMLTQGYDDQHFKTNLELPVFEAHGIKFGVAICHTTSFVEPAQYLRYKGARLLFTPHFNNMHPDVKLDNGVEVNYWGHRTMVLNNQSALATLLKMVVVRSNIIDIKESGLGSGDSNIWDMDGVVVAEGRPFVEEIVTAEFDSKIFLEEHFINRNEVPVELLGMIYEASKAYGGE